jgi:hypothetical protein
VCKQLGEREPTAQAAQRQRVSSTHQTWQQTER